MNLVERTNKEITLKDPIHGSITIEHLIFKKLLETREFQRLRRIRQLGFTYTVFHTATHDRFSHSLGAYELARRLVFKNNKFDILDENKKMYICIAALLHDIGHGPFSHSFEHVFEFDHEEMTCKLLTDENTEVHCVLSSFDKNLPAIITSIINKTYEDKLVVNIISGDVDVDRMDYLMRDSYFTSTALGIYDQFQLIKQMEIVDGELVINEKAIDSLESFFIARHHMFNQVYTHVVSGSFETQGEWFLRRLIDLNKENYEFSFDIKCIKPFLESNFTIDQFIALDDYDIYNLWKGAYNDRDIILSTTARNLLDRKKCGIIKTTTSKVDFELDNLKTISKRVETASKTLTEINIKIKTIENELVSTTDFSPILTGLILDKGNKKQIIIYYI